MEVTLKTGDVEMTLNVADNDEAVSLFAKVAHLNASTNGATIKSTSATKTSEQPEEISETSFRNALMMMKGRPSGRMLLVLAGHAEGCDDSVLRDALTPEGGETFNIGPAFAHVSKCCGKVRVPKEAVYTRRAKRGPRGKMKYHYQLTDLAIRLIGEIGEFDRDPAFVDI